MRGGLWTQIGSAEDGISIMRRICMNRLTLVPGAAAPSRPDSTSTPLITTVLIRSIVC